MLIDTIRVGGNYRTVRDGPGWSIFTAQTQSGTSEVGRLRTLDSICPLTPGASGPRLHLIAGTAWVEGSIGKSRRGSNYPAATIEETSETVAAWLEEAREWVDFESEEPRINRLDVVRDFDLGSSIVVGSVLDGLASAPLVGRKVKARYRDQANQGAETLHVRTRTAGMGRLYDKHAETRGEVAAGVLRFEAQERKRSLRAAGVHGIGDLTADRVDALGTSRFGWCGFAVAFEPWDALLAQVMAADDLRDGTKLQLLGWYSMARTGRGLGIERTLDFRMRKLAARFGLPGGAQWRLDVERGLVAA